jgi:outer membrane protein OmpA-like peptidoglycan-associated protein
MEHNTHQRKLHLPKDAIFTHNHEHVSHDPARGESKSLLKPVMSRENRMVFQQELVGQIFFATNESKLADADIRTINRIYSFYAALLFGETLVRDPIRPKVHLKFVGYADFRGDEDKNLGLSQRRAEAVAHYCMELKKAKTYSQGIVAMGEAENPQTVKPAPPSISTQLNPFRRVDIFGSPSMQKIPDPPRHEPEGSKKWAIRLVLNASLSVFFAGGYYARFEIVDRKHNRGMLYTMKLGGYSIGGIKTPLKNITLGASASLQGWKFFDTPEYLEFKDFEGDVSHFGVSLVAIAGWSSDRFYLFGPRGKLEHSIAVEYPMSFSLSWSAAFGLDYEFYGKLKRYRGAYDMPKDLDDHTPLPREDLIEEMLYDNPPVPTDK